jgi:hypothetical protein
MVGATPTHGACLYSISVGRTLAMREFESHPVSIMDVGSSVGRAPGGRRFESDLYNVRW